MSDACGRPIVRGTAAAGRERRVAERGAVVSAVWIVGGVAAVAAVIAVIASWQRGGRTDLGTVSTNWISEHRLGSNQEYSRR
jgi:hypothetical protein